LLESLLARFDPHDRRIDDAVLQRVGERLFVTRCAYHADLLAAQVAERIRRKAGLDDEPGTVDEGKAREVNRLHAPKGHGTRAAFHIRLSLRDCFETGLPVHGYPTYLDLADAELALDRVHHAPTQVDAVPDDLLVRFKGKRRGIGSVGDSYGLRVSDRLQTSIESVSVLGK